MELTPPILLKTARLRLYAARTEHAISVFEEYTGREDASRYLQRGPHPSPDRTQSILEAWGEKNWQNNSRYVWTITQSDEQVVGLFLMFVEDRTAEIHYGIGPRWWGNGIATEAGRAVMDWIINKSDLEEVATCCAADHAVSIKVLDKIGLHRVQFLSAHLYLPASDEKVDAWTYGWTRPVKCHWSAPRFTGQIG